MSNYSLQEKSTKFIILIFATLLTIDVKTRTFDVILSYYCCFLEWILLTCHNRRLYKALKYSRQMRTWIILGVARILPNYFSCFPRNSRPDFPALPSFPVGLYCLCFIYVTHAAFPSNDAVRL